jgi:hypothetical protein
MKKVTICFTIFRLPSLQRHQLILPASQIAIATIIMIMEWTQPINYREKYWTSFDHHQFSLLIPTAEIGYAPPYTRFPYTHLQTVIDSGKEFEADFRGTGQVDNMRAYF